jgi:putative flippase GtrA
MIKYTRERLLKLTEIEFIRFCIVGGTGFVINFVLLNLFHHVLKLPIYLAQLFGSEIALFSNFILHHNWTYRHHRVQKSARSLILQFHATSWPAIIGSTLMVTLLVRVGHQKNLEALVIASIVALAWNFVWSKFVVWRDVESDNLEEIA